MLSPQFLDAIPEPIVELYSDTELKLIDSMVKRIERLLKLTDSTQYQFERAIAIGSMQEYIIEQMSIALHKSQNDIRDIFVTAGTKAIASDDQIYRSWGLNPEPINNSPVLLQILNIGLQKTNGTFKNLTRTTADTATRFFENALDQAYNMVLSSGFTYQDAIKFAVKDLVKKGIAVIKYPTNHTDFMDVAVRRAILTGVNQTAAGLQIARMDELDIDLVETSSHSGARPSHAEWQGKRFSRFGKTKGYPDFVSSTGYGDGAGLCGWNCKHNFYPVLESEPLSRTRKELNKMNHESVTYTNDDGEKVEVSRYYATQKQRYNERQIRQWKRQKASDEALGHDPSSANSKIREWRKKQRAFIQETGLRRDYFRERAGKQND